MREALFRLAATDARLGEAGHISGWWPRNITPEIDLVGVDRRDRPTAVRFAGSIKWRQSAPLSANDLRELAIAAAHIPRKRSLRLLFAFDPRRTGILPVGGHKGG